MDTKIILITGKKQSGKSTSATYLESKLSRNDGSDGRISVRQYSFADPLKRFLIDVFGLTEAQCYGTDEDKNSATLIKWGDLPLQEEELKDLFYVARNNKVNDGSYNPSYSLTARELMQIWGTQICRSTVPDCWAIGTLNRILNEKPKVAIICDARFPNEIDIFLPYNPIVIRLQRNPFNSNHESEIALNYYDWNKIGANLINIDNRDMDENTKNRWVWNCVEGLICS